MKYFIKSPYWTRHNKKDTSCSNKNGYTTLITNELLVKISSYFGTETDAEWAEKYEEELLYVYNNGYDLGDWDGWYSIEMLLGYKIPWEQYSVVNRTLWEENIDTIGIWDECQDDKRYKKEILRKIKKIIHSA